ncbi:hypothetical protein OSB04_008611 [Centaurea solstitialis]|uniref:Uncharacterized protein n=1 Tax=Centaurea solstitialis TaxID=347529 RepID=A0AA38WTZ4_9ASTR|nr:hypothetical protein OSB04_008611 [Centaurea solstitialis]
MLLLLFKTLEVEGDDVFSKCLSNASLIRFRSNGPPPPPPTISDLADDPPRSLYFLNECVNLGYHGFVICKEMIDDEYIQDEFNLCRMISEGMQSVKAIEIWKEWNGMLSGLARCLVDMK